MRVTPTLVLLDGPTGNLITTNGRDALSEDLEGKDFPWGPKSLDEVLTGELLKGSETCDCKTALDGKVKAFYFSAHWVICFVVCDVSLTFGMNCLPTLVYPVLSHSSAPLVVSILTLIVTFNARSYCVLLRFTYSRGIALEA